MASPESHSPGDPSSPTARGLSWGGYRDDSSADEATGFIPPASRRSLRSLQSAVGNKRSSIYDRPSRTPTAHEDSTDDNAPQARGAEVPPGGGPGEQKGLWKRTLASFQSVELENKGSVARDHLALGKPPSHNKPSRNLGTAPID